MTRRKFLKLSLLITTASFVGGGVSTAVAKVKNIYYNGVRTDHFDGVKFFNPAGTNPKGLGGLLRWKLGSRAAKWPSTYPSPFAGTKPETSVDNLAITMVGHATLLIQINGLNFLTDPIFTERASPFSFVGPKRIAPPGVSLEDLPKIDGVLLSHNHYDHLDKESLKWLVENHDPLIITPLGNDTIIHKSIPKARVQTGDWGDVVKLGKAKIHFEPMHHWSARKTSDRRMALWAAFVVESKAGKVYFVGDTGFHDGINFKAVRKKHGGFKASIVPIGAYSPRWFMKDVHQNPEEAVQSHILCNAEVSIAHHWGMFQLTNEPIEEPIERLAAARSAAGLNETAFLALKPGEAWNA
ncbi:MAG: MBL fold metallo-hydrolase [Hyphomicrobiales bacterium]